MSTSNTSAYLILVLFVIAPLPAFAGEADVVGVEVSCNDDSICHFDVSVKHSDEGWAHYANKWEVLSPDGDVLGVRELLHPHEDEQPFTRSLSGVRIPADLTEVVIRAHDLDHGYGGKEFRAKLPAAE